MQGGQAGSRMYVIVMYDYQLLSLPGGVFLSMDFKPIHTLKKLHFLWIELNSYSSD